MTAFVQAISNLSLTFADSETEALQMLATFCAASLLVSMFFASVGFDLGSEFF